MLAIVVAVNLTSSQKNRARRRRSPSTASPGRRGRRLGKSIGRSLQKQGDACGLAQ